MEWQDIEIGIEEDQTDSGGVGARDNVKDKAQSGTVLGPPGCEDTVISMMEVDDGVDSSGTGTSSTSDSTRTLIIVPDTNIWIHSLKILQELLGSTYSKYLVNIIIPWMVLHEIDGLKRGVETKDKALAAGKFINDLLVSKGLLKGQKPHEEKLAQTKYFPKLSTDDSILQCALQWTDKFPEKKVIFISDDNNLRSKAVILEKSNLYICNSRSVLPTVDKESGREQERRFRKAKLPSASVGSSSGSKIRKSANDKNWTPPPEWSTPPKSKVRRPSSKSSCSRNRKRSRSDSSSSQKTFSFSPPPGSEKEADEEQDGAEPMDMSPIKKRFCPNDRRVAGSCSPNAAGSENSGWDDILKLLHRTFCHIIEFTMKEDLGENLWEKSLKVKPPWTFYTALKCIDAHWVPIFSFVFTPKGKSDLNALIERVKHYKPSSSSHSGGRDRNSPNTENEILELGISLLGAGIRFSKTQTVKEASVQECYKRLQEYSKTKSESS